MRYRLDRYEYIILGMGQGEREGEGGGESVFSSPLHNQTTLHM